MQKLIVILISLVLAACATQLGIKDKVDLRRQMFSQVVFAPDFDSRRKDYLAKWTSPPRIKLEDHNTRSIDKYKYIVTGQAKALEKSTGLKISLATETNPANVTITFDILARIQKLTRSSVGKSNITNTGCHTEIDKSSDHRITAARILVVINPDAESIQLMNGTLNAEEEVNEKARITQCLVKGLLQTLGFVNSSDVITPSIFNTVRNLLHPTSLDLRLIRTLYDPSLTAGMPRRLALQAAEPLLK
jgi:hypothetical protein